MKEQRTLAMANGFERYANKTRRALFLEQMEQVVPWKKLCRLIEPYYPKAGNVRRPVGLERMLRIYFLQQWFNLSDPGVEDGLYESPVMRQFVGIDLGQEPAPDETTVCKFRHLLEEHNLGGEMRQTVNLHLESKGIRISQGTTWRGSRGVGRSGLCGADRGDSPSGTPCSGLHQPALSVSRATECGGVLA